MSRGHNPDRTAESRFRSARNATLGLGAAGLALWTEVQSNALATTSVVSLAFASGAELWRFIVSPDSPRKARVMSTVGKAVGALVVVAAAQNLTESVTLLANDTEPVTVGIVGTHNFITREHGWQPEGNEAIGGYAAADGALAALQVFLGVNVWRRQEESNGFSVNRSSIPT